VPFSSAFIAVDSRNIKLVLSTYSVLSGWGFSVAHRLGVPETRGEPVRIATCRPQRRKHVLGEANVVESDHGELARDCDFLFIALAHDPHRRHVVRTKNGRWPLVQAAQTAKTRRPPSSV
jgi:hypothetical protein